MNRRGFLRQALGLLGAAAVAPAKIFDIPITTIPGIGNILDGGATGADNSLIWLPYWNDGKLYCISPLRVYETKVKL